MDIMGRNFDYYTGHPALLLFTKPSEGYSSVSMVDISHVGTLPEPLKRFGLMASPYIPMDGMNEWGLTVALISVPNSRASHDPNKVTLTHTNVIRLALDYAKTVDEAVQLWERYN